MIAPAHPADPLDRFEEVPDPAAIRQSLKRNQAERSILRQMLKLSVRAQEWQGENANPGDMPERRDA